MEKTFKWKKWIWIPALLLIIALITIGAVIVQTVQANETESLFNLSERDVVLEVGESKKVELESEEIKINDSKIKVTWISSKPSVATVGSDGTITAAAGGEARITAIVEYKDHEYSTSCVVTVKAEGNEYSTYKIRWFTQTKDRSDYKVVEETFERLVGSEANLTQLDAKKNCPSNYVLNTKKSRLTGKVKGRLGACVLEVYFDVAEVQYSIDYYYESATALGTYTEKETKKYTAYAFSKVEVTDAPKTGFVINNKVSGTVMSKDSVVAGSKLKVYCDRIHSKVTVDYISSRADATYKCIYGIGLINAPADVFSDSIEYKITTYVNGEKKQATADLMKKVTTDTTVEFKLDGEGFTYSKGTITNKTSKKATPSYAVLKGSGNTVYLSATYKTTGSVSNTFGITLKSGKTSREIRFSKQGVAIMMDNTTTGGVLSSKSTTNAYRSAGSYNSGDVFVWAQNSKGNGSTVVSSVVNNMLKNKNGGSYDICWAVLEGVLYCNVEGQPVLRLPLSYLDETWTANQQYEIGFSAYDASAWADELKISNVKNAYGKEAKALLVTDKQFESELVQNMAYDAITGNYLPASGGGAAYMYGQATSENTGLSATVNWVDKDNTASAIGISLKMGDESIQYVVEGMNNKIRTQKNHKWGDSAARKDLKKQTLAEVTPFNEGGTTQVTAFVKDGYFHVLYNGVQAYCANMMSLYPEYTPDSEVSVGICSWDANLGLASFSNVTELTTADIAAGIAGAEDWGFYAEAGGLSADAYDFTAESITKSTKNTNTVTLLGSNATWQIKGIMNRPLDGKKADLLMGFIIKVGEKMLQITGRNNGFETVVNNDWSTRNRAYDTNPSVYAFNNIVSNKFFNKNNENTRTQETIDFKAVLYKDVLYVWFTDEAGNSGLCWRVPLTEEKFGGFDKGSNYEVVLYMGNSDTRGSMTNLDVKMGYQVTDQTEFIVDEAGTKYTVAEAVETIDANVARWENSFVCQTISGNLAEAIDFRYESQKQASSYAYLNGADTDVFLTATYELEKNKKATFFGITLKGDDGEQRALLYNWCGVSMLQNNKWAYNEIPAISSISGASHNYYNQARDGYVWVEKIVSSSDQRSLVQRMTAVSTENRTYDAKWALTDGVLYGMVDDFVFFRMPVEKLCATWDEDTEFQIGFAQRDAHSSNGDVKITKNIEVSFGEDALAKMVKDKKVTTLSGSGIEYEVFHGTYLPYSAGGTKYLYSTATNETQVLKTTIESIEGKSTNTAGYGFTVQSGSSSAQIALWPDSGIVKILQNHKWGTPLEVTSWLPANIKKFDDNGICKVTAVVKDSTLYFFYHDTLAGSVDLYKLLSGYKEGDSVQLGICARDPQNGLAAFTDISFATGEEAVKGIAFNDNLEWEIFTNKDSVIAHAGTQMSSNGSTGVVQPEYDKGGASYIYGAATSMPQKLETKITLANYSNLTAGAAYSSNGITIESEGQSVQFAIEGIRQQIRIINNYTWSPCTREDIAAGKTAYDTKTGVYDITAIVKDGWLYMKYNEQVAYKVALTKLFPGYESGDSVRLGLFSWDQKQNVSTFSDVSFAAGAGVNIDNTAYDTIEYLVEAGNDYNVNNGVVTKSGTKAAELVMKGSSATWEVSGTYTRTDSNSGDLLAGFKISSSDNVNNKLLVLGAKAGVAFIGNNGTGGNVWCNSDSDYRNVGNKYVIGAIPDTFSASPKDKDVSFKAIISNNILYVWIDGNPVWRVPLNENLYNKAGTTLVKSAFANDTAYKFGFYMASNSNKGAFNVQTVKTSGIDTAAVAAFETAYQNKQNN